MSTPSEKHSLAYKLSLIRMVLGIDIKAVKPSVIDSISKAKGFDLRMANGRMVVICE